MPWMCSLPSLSTETEPVVAPTGEIGQADRHRDQQMFRFALNSGIFTASLP